MDCGVDICLDTEATPELVMAENPDAIVVAIGARPARPTIPGIDRPNIFNVLDVDAGRKKISGRIVVCGGGLSGCESGLGLAVAGCEVTVVDKIPVVDFASGISDLTRRMLFALLNDNHVRLIGEHLIRSIGVQGVLIEGKDWEYETLPADFVVEAFGMKSNRETADRFVELIPDVYIVGDANEVGNIKRATQTAHNICVNI
jgi:pyruvate/2-oxoglutarate dehydrogenase complex dihydrolipoamide dehydrogenase (E3) component